MRYQQGSYITLIHQHACIVFVKEIKYILISNGYVHETLYVDVFSACPFLSLMFFNIGTCAMGIFSHNHLVERPLAMAALFLAFGS